ARAAVVGDLAGVAIGQARGRRGVLAVVRRPFRQADGGAADHGGDVEAGGEGGRAIFAGLVAEVGGQPELAALLLAEGLGGDGDQGVERGRGAFAGAEVVEGGGGDLDL